MANRTIFQALDFDRSYIHELMGAPVSNSSRMDVIRRALREAIESELTPRQREVVMLYYFDRRGEAAIARQLGISPSTVSRTLTRARKRLQHSMRFYIEFLNCGSLRD